MIRELQEADLPAVLAIYNYYVINSNATLDHRIMSMAKMKKKAKDIQKKFPYLVYEENGKVLGYCYASPWKEKHGYDKTVESTVYLSPDAIGKGIGTIMYFRLIELLRKQGVTCIIGGLTLPNTQSVALHEKFGFVKAAHFNQIAEKFDKLVDVGYWQLNLLPE